MVDGVVDDASSEASSNLSSTELCADGVVVVAVGAVTYELKKTWAAPGLRGEFGEMARPNPLLGRFGRARGCSGVVERSLEDLVERGDGMWCSTNISATVPDLVGAAVEKSPVPP